MPRRLNITIQQREKIFKLYAKKYTASEISRSVPDLKLSSKQIQNLICKEGWAKRKTEIAEVEDQSVVEVLSDARKNAVGKLKAFLESHAESLQNDAKQLEDGWGMVEGAADASALMRSKKLLLDRAFDYFGASAQSEAPQSVNLLAAIVGRPIRNVTETVNVEPATLPEPDVADETDDATENDELDFA